MTHATPDTSRWKMPDEPDAIVFVFAPSWSWFVDWCQVDNYPPLNPKDVRFRYVDVDQQGWRRVHGRYARSSDAVLVLGGRFPNEEARAVLVTCGFDRVIDPSTNINYKLGATRQS